MVQYNAAFCQLSHARMTCSGPLLLRQCPFCPLVRSDFAVGLHTTVAEAATGARRRERCRRSIQAVARPTGRATAPVMGPSRLAGRVREVADRGAGAPEFRNLSAGDPGDGRQMTGLTSFFPALSLFVSPRLASVRLLVVAGVCR